MSISRFAESLAADQDGVLSRAVLRGLGVDADRVRNQVRAGRWRLHGRQTVALHTGELSAVALRWRAIWEVGVGIAAVDGVSALMAAGLQGYGEGEVHVSVSHRHNRRRVAGVRVHAVRDRPEEHLLDNGLPRTRPEVASIRAAHWAVSDRQAALLLLMPVQQRIVSTAKLATAVDQVRGRTRRAFIRQVVADAVDGAHSLGELDLGVYCRRRGLPPPRRQVRRSGPRGRVYLDARWDADQCGCGRPLVVEVDGSGHRQGLAVTEDNLRANAVTLADDRVLRFDLVGLRLEPDAFMDQLEIALR